MLLMYVFILGIQIYLILKYILIEIQIFHFTVYFFVYCKYVIPYFLFYWFFKVDFP